MPVDTLTVAAPPYNRRVADRRNNDADDADDDFARAMAAEKVVPLSPERRARAHGAPPVRLRPASRHSGVTSTGLDAEEQDHEFAANGVNRREIGKLKRGDYTPADRRDLHGMTATEASASVRRFIDTSRRNSCRCVCIVHGRGVRSPGGVAVLKARVRGDLRSHPAVLAYADAPPSDGGGGAVYVLLRRRP
jgi:DNA-nicking Smr family endonuclease